VKWSLVCAVSALIVLTGVCVAPAELIVAESSLEAVTVYRGQALVTRSVALPAKQGELEIIVGDLPAQVAGSSLSASVGATEGVAIRSVRYRTRAAAEAPKKEVAALDAQIKELTARIYANTQRKALLRAKSTHLDKLESFSAPTAQVELSKGVLDPKTLAEVSKLILAQREALTEEAIKLHQDEQEMTEQLALLQRKRSELTRGAGRTVREAVIFLSKTAPGAATVQLSYLVNSANWAPAYNIRLADDGKTVNVEYLAEVNQMTGEDWSDVKLTLSTATPGMNARSPLLAPLWVGLFQPTVPEGKAVKKVLLAKDGYAHQRVVLFRGQRAYVNPTRPAADAGWDLNTAAVAAQEMELNVNREALLAGGEAVRPMEEVLAVSYGLPGKMSLASRSDRQLVEISRLKLRGKVYYEAIPLLSNYVYRAGDLNNTSRLPLLSGSYSAYIRGEFVGRGKLPVVARGQQFTIGLGVDTQLRCRRELTDKSDKVVWGSRVQNFHYRLLLENFKDTPVAVRVMERIPATKTDALKVALGHMSEELSTDPVYVRDLKDKGLLRWEIELAGGAAGAKARQLEYAFEMKFAKDRHVGELTAGLVKEMEREYRQMMLAH